MKAHEAVDTRGEHAAFPDLTDQIKALREAHERLQAERADDRAALERVTADRDRMIALINQVPDQLFVKDLKSRFLIANEAVVADKKFIATGEPVTVEALIGKTDFDLFSAEIAQEFRRTEITIMQQGQAMRSMIEQNVYSDGRLKWVSMTKAPLRDENGTVIGLVGVAHDVTFRKEAEDRVLFLAHYDPLTGLPNRASIFEKLTRAIDEASQNETRSAVVFLDLDNFKSINDTYGHQGGDEVLKATAARLVNCLGPEDSVGRFGGDEFVILLRHPPEDRSALLLLIDGMREHLSGPIQIGGQTLRVTISLGVSRLPDDGATLDEILAKADAAMYRSKSSGRDRTTLAD
ncbi:GGDEF domain-containing protein [Pararhizobium arenae]|uniref:GGDEF domain-containing protein n=1 Tax=Pararhizobium arenae TaxID=1856850 RepID=UPI00094B71F5|nr:GGDEF domain-containing protein [Pararhizobium arenae]